MNARERILDAAAEVMRTRGLAETTTREIARQAGCSEALLYKHFSDKQQIFTSVLKERMPSVTAPEALVGTGEVVENLESLVAELIAFYRESFPVAASMLGSASLREAHRAAVGADAGPRVPAAILERYLAGEAAAGRVREDAAAAVVARVLAGAALFEALESAYADTSPDAASAARAIVSVVIRGLADGAAPAARVTGS